MQISWRSFDLLLFCFSIQSSVLEYNFLLLLSEFDHLALLSEFNLLLCCIIQIKSCYS